MNATVATEEATFTFRKTKSGEWVAYGPWATANEMVNDWGAYEIGITKKDGSMTYRTISRLGRPFTVNGEEMVYAYLAAEPRQPRSRRFSTVDAPGCPNNGDCMTFNPTRPCRQCR